MPEKLFKNLANIIVIFRSILVFLVIFLLNSQAVIPRISGFVLLILIVVMDWFDGYVARRFSISSKVGALMDTLGDRITENLLLVFFAYKQLIPIAVPLIFIARSFASDFIRFLSYRNGITTFEINKSKLGIFFVASKPSRVLYLVFKIVIFSLAGFVLVVESLISIYRLDLHVFLANSQHVLFYGSIILVIFNLLRFILLVYDSRFILKETFTNGF